MKTQSISKTIVLIAACGMGFISASASAGPDLVQFWLNQQAVKAAQARQEVKKTEVIQLTECKKLMEQTQERK